MFVRSLVKEALWRALAVTLMLVYLVVHASAQVMTSGSYQIQSDSINMGGGLSSSTSYVIESTAGEIATGESGSTNYSLRAGYQQMQEVFISLTPISDVVLSPALGGLTGGTSNGSTTFTVTTDSPSGYSVTFGATLAPAMQSAVGTIANYVPVSGVPDFVFDTSSNEAHFGFSPEGSDVIARYRDNGSTCGTGSGDTVLACWDMVSTTPQVILSGSDANHPLGATSTLRFRVGIGSTAGVIAGQYTATTTITALPL